MVKQSTHRETIGECLAAIERLRIFFISSIFSSRCGKWFNVYHNLIIVRWIHFKFFMTITSISTESPKETCIKARGCSCFAFRTRDETFSQFIDCHCSRLVSWSWCKWHLQCLVRWWYTYVWRCGDCDAQSWLRQLFRPNQTSPKICLSVMTLIRNNLIRNKYCLLNGSIAGSVSVKMFLRTSEPVGIVWHPLIWIV